jgi:NAD(P)-dependent dehydrogenase (short-subunit alcohol dehydrogenase family)
VFTSAHSYLIVGGTGGLGLSIARWMAQKGATNLVLISRNAETSPNTKALSAELAAVGCRLLVRNCDAANKKSLDSAIKDCYQSMPQIKGVIQAAMLLQVRTTFADAGDSMHDI